MADYKTAEALFRENEKLAYFVLHKRFPDFSTNEDMRQIALIGLWRACLSYDRGKQAEFSTFACTCVANEVYKSLRAQKKASGVLVVSLYDTLPDNDDLLLVDTIADPVEGPENSDLFLRDAIERLPEKVKTMMLLLADGLSQKDAAKRAGVSPQAVSITLARYKNKIMRGGEV